MMEYVVLSCLLPNSQFQLASIGVNKKHTHVSLQTKSNTQQTSKNNTWGFVKKKHEPFQMVFPKYRVFPLIVFPSAGFTP
jgi:hypothetical protein